MQYDVLIIGAGASALSSALFAKQEGLSVALVTKEFPTRAQTSMAQGGINAALGKDDTVELHIEDTLKSSHALADEKMVQHLCQSAPEAIEWLDSIGVCFSRTPNGEIAQRKLGGAKHPRACYAQDYTGLKILHTLYDQVNKENIDIFNQRFLLDILTKEQKIIGATFLNMRNSQVETFSAKSVIVATGGYAKIYGKHSTNSKSSTGDGLVAAYKAGAILSNLEFIQFHPTALKNSSILISESARGAGGYLVDNNEQRFCDELRPRDEVSRAIYEQMKKSDVFLDLRHLDKKFIEESLPQEQKLAKLYEDIDLTKELIPIKPAAHYSMGGIEVDANSQTNIEGLFSVGECANHNVHGANRLGGNSLLELIVFGKDAAKGAASYAKTQEFQTVDAQESQQEIDTIFQYEGGINLYDMKDLVADLFYKNVGILRKESELQEALDALKNIKNNLSKIALQDKTKEFNQELIELLEFHNMVELAQLIVMSALKRKESRGAHYRADFLEESAEFAQPTRIAQGEFL